MRFRPILFNTEMIKAILEGRKTQTRRLLRRICAYSIMTGLPANNPPCKPGDILWVRETWYKDAGRYMYRANYSNDEKFYRDGKEVRLRWQPSIHMPKEAARIFLRVKDVRVERLHDMDEESAVAEGFTDSPAGTDSPLQRFAELWDKTIKREDLRDFGYHANPFVWVIEFERYERPEGWEVS